MGNGLTRLQTRFWGDEAGDEAAAKRKGEALEAEDAAELGLVTVRPGRHRLGRRDPDRDSRSGPASAPTRSPGWRPTTGSSARRPWRRKIFGRLTAWQNWIFNRPNASGPDGALRRYGTGQRAVFDRKRV